MGYAYFIYIVVAVAIMGVSIFLIYTVISSRFLRYPPLVVSSGETRSAIIYRVSKRIKKIEADGHFKSPFTIVEAGCGVGTLIVPLARNLPDHEFIGLEWSLPAFIICKFRARNIDNIKILHQDMFSYNFHQANILICFLIGHLMTRFARKCEKELTKKTYIFSNRFKMDGWEEMKTMDFGDKFSYLHIYKYRPWEAGARRFASDITPGEGYDVEGERVQ